MEESQNLYVELRILEFINFEKKKNGKMGEKVQKEKKYK